MADERSNTIEGIIEYTTLRSEVPKSVPKPAPYVFMSSKTVCSLYEVGGFKLGADTLLVDETVTKFLQQMKGMKHVAAFMAATANDQTNAATLLTKAGFKAIATWPGNGCHEVTLWLLVQRTRPKKKKGGEADVPEHS